MAHGYAWIRMDTLVSPTRLLTVSVVDREVDRRRFERAMSVGAAHVSHQTV